MTPYQEYVAQRKKDNGAARSKPLKEGLSLTAVRKSNLSGPYPVVPQPDISLPTTLQPRPQLDPLDLPEDPVLVLLRNLRSSDEDLQTEESGNWGQIWLASIQTVTGQLSGPILVKLFQESLFPLQDRHDFKLYEIWCAATQSANEAWAFETLKPLQGSLLPHSYGFYDFALPCGQTVCGHVMEYIEGDPLRRDYEGMLNASWDAGETKDMRRVWLENLAEGVHRMHCLGVHHGDLSISNILRLRSDPNNFVFIDFARACPPSACTIHVRYDEEGLQDALWEMEDCVVVAAWLEEKRAENVPWALVYGEFSLESRQENATMQESIYKDRAKALGQSRLRQRRML